MFSMSGPCQDLGVCISMRVFATACTHVYAHIHEYIFEHAYAYEHVYMYIYTHAYMPVCVIMLMNGSTYRHLPYKLEESIDKLDRQRR